MGSRTCVYLWMVGYIEGNIHWRVQYTAELLGGASTITETSHSDERSITVQEEENLNRRQARCPDIFGLFTNREKIVVCLRRRIRQTCGKTLTEHAYNGGHSYDSNSCQQSIRVVRKSPLVPRASCHRD